MKFDDGKGVHDGHVLSELELVHVALHEDDRRAALLVLVHGQCALDCLVDLDGLKNNCKNSSSRPHLILSNQSTFVHHFLLLLIVLFTKKEKKSVHTVFRVLR